jgi:hypothetical protein
LTRASISPVLAQGRGLLHIFPEAEGLYVRLPQFCAGTMAG